MDTLWSHLEGFKLIGKMKIHAEVPSEFNPTENEYPDEVVVHPGEEEKVTRINADGLRN